MTSLQILALAIPFVGAAAAIGITFWRSHSDERAYAGTLAKVQDKEQRTPPADLIGRWYKTRGMNPDAFGASGVVIAKTFDIPGTTASTIVGHIDMNITNRAR